MIKTLHALFATAILATPSLAAAHDSCPWSGDVWATATMTTVTVDGETYPVQGQFARTEFHELLVACGAAEAALQFTRWRDARTVTNATAAGGVVIDDRAFIGTLAASLFAGKHKRAMLRALESSTFVDAAVADASAE